MIRNRRRLLPRPRVMLGTLLLAVFLGVLIVQAYVNAEFTSDHAETEVGDSDGVPLAIRTGGPVLNTTGGQQSSSRLPPRTIALTFDDGPDPTWTREVLDVLEGAPRARARSSSSAPRWPATRSWPGGWSAGATSSACTRSPTPTCSAIAPWRRTLEMSQTQLAIAGAAGVRTSLVRLPYSSKRRRASTTRTGRSSRTPAGTAT